MQISPARGRAVVGGQAEHPQRSCAEGGGWDLASGRSLESRRGSQRTGMSAYLEACWGSSGHAAAVGPSASARVMQSRPTAWNREQIFRFR